jgi:hypothetical protein
VREEKSVSGTDAKKREIGNKEGETTTSFFFVTFSCESEPYCILAKLTTGFVLRTQRKHGFLASENKTQLAVVFFQTRISDAKKGNKGNKRRKRQRDQKEPSKNEGKYPYPAKMPHAGGPPPCPELLCTAKINE